MWRTGWGNDHQQFYANLYRHLPVVARPFVPQSTQEFGLARASGSPLSIAAQALSDALKREIQLSQKSTENGIWAGNLIVVISRKRGRHSA